MRCLLLAFGNAGAIVKEAVAGTPRPGLCRPPLRASGSEFTLMA